jgi:hypothetical protein
MMGGHFYHKRMRTCVALFGSMFNDMHILRTAADGKVLSQVKLPLTYAPRRNFISRLEEMSKGEQSERKVALKLPRMSFEVSSISYDSARQLPKVNQVSVESKISGNRQDVFCGVPYKIGFELNIYAKSQDDALQVVEQILPYFAPQYSLSVKPFSDYPEIKEDIPVTLTGVNFSDDFEGPVEQRRTIIYTLSFDMNANFYGPIKTGTEIREVNTELNAIVSDIGDTDFLSNVRVTPDPIDVNSNGDFGFNIEITDDRQS